MSIKHFPERSKDSHKGSFGRALLVGGSRGMAGAIALSATSALRGGAGLVTVATADVCLETVAGFNPCLMTVALPNDSAGRIAAESLTQIQSLAEKSDCVAIGPGLGQSDDLIQLVVELYEEVTTTMVIDADALNCLSQHGIESLNAKGPRILTPHLGEFRRLVGSDDLKLKDAASRAMELSKRTGAVVLLKGHKTIVTDGETQFENKTGNPGMATAGSGDVLTGLITALICQHFSPLEAACTGAHLHGMAGDFAAETLGEISMTAQDIIDAISIATRRNVSETRRIGFPV